MNSLQTTYIVRLCKTDAFLKSYVEMPLTCDGLSEEQNGNLTNAYYQEKIGTEDFSLSGTTEGALYVTFNNGEYRMSPIIQSQNSCRDEPSWYF